MLSKLRKCLFHFLVWLDQGCPSNFPKRGKDAVWTGYCKKCKKYRYLGSRNGFFNGGTTHCYDCGHEWKTSGFNLEDIESLKRRSSIEWKELSPCPYYWHQLTPIEREQFWQKNKDFSNDR